MRGPLWQAVLQHNLRVGVWLDVVRVGDPPDLPLATDDSALLQWAEREGRTLVTEDRFSRMNLFLHFNSFFTYFG